MKNQVIEVLNKDHGAKVIKYWRSKDADTGYFKGYFCKAYRNPRRYYGVINGEFMPYTFPEVEAAGAEIIELPDESSGHFSIYQEFFDFLHQEHDVIATVDQMTEIVNEAQKLHKKLGRDKSNGIWTTLFFLDFEVYADVYLPFRVNVGDEFSLQQFSDAIEGSDWQVKEAIEYMSTEPDDYKCTSVSWSIGDDNRITMFCLLKQ